MLCFLVLWSTGFTQPVLGSVSLLTLSASKVGWLQPNRPWKSPCPTLPPEPSLGVAWQGASLSGPKRTRTQVNALMGSMVQF